MEQYFIADQWIRWIILLAVLWTLPWKGVALWKAVKNNSKWWFVIILVVNTLGILEILYIFYFSRKVAGFSGAKNAYENYKNALDILGKIFFGVILLAFSVAFFVYDQYMFSFLTLIVIIVFSKLDQVKKFVAGRGRVEMEVFKEKDRPKK